MFCSCPRRVEVTWMMRGLQEKFSSLYSLPSPSWVPRPFSVHWVRSNESYPQMGYKYLYLFSQHSTISFVWLREREHFSASAEVILWCFLTPAVNSQTSAVCSRIRFNCETICLELAPDPTRSALSPRRLLLSPPPCLDFNASGKHQVSLIVLTNWL